VRARPGAGVEHSPLGAIVVRHLTTMSGLIEVEVDCCVVMPNHFHAVFVLNGTRTLGNVVGSLKASTAREINVVRKAEGPFWQRGFFEHVVRNDVDLDRVREYVVTNPIRWSSPA
jgi:putative transposase